MRNAKTVSCLGWLLLVVGLICQNALAQEKKTFVAYSMKVAQARVEEAIRKGEDFRKKQPDLFYLGGITKPWAVVLDAKTGDWILVGERDPKSSVLTLDDWVVAGQVWNLSMLNREDGAGGGGRDTQSANLALKIVAGRKLNGYH
jgi:hypothetical protein